MPTRTGGEGGEGGAWRAASTLKRAKAGERPPFGSGGGIAKWSTMISQNDGGQLRNYVVRACVRSPGQEHG